MRRPVIAELVTIENGNRLARPLEQRRRSEARDTGTDDGDVDTDVVLQLR